MNCKEKKAYDYYLDAGSVVSFFRLKNKKLYVYLCAECSKFHLTSKLNKKNTVSRRTFKKMGMYQGTCDKHGTQCNGDVVFRKKHGMRLCIFHNKEINTTGEFKND